jgi:hypothetical protein
MKVQAILPADRWEAGVKVMSKNRTLSLSALFLTIAVLVSGSLVLSLRSDYAPGGRSPALNAALHLLQNA